MNTPRFRNIFNVEFRVICQHNEEAVCSVSSFLKNYGVKIHNLREADVVKDSDNSKIDSIYVLCCTGSMAKYNFIKERGRYQEIEYEGYRTLV